MTEYKVTYENENLLRLARKRVREKQRYIRNVLLYILASFFLFFAISASYYDDFMEGVFWGIWIGLSVLMSGSTIKYLAPRLLINKNKKDPVEAEYEKLKKMDYDEIAREFSKM